ncbi:ActS/PrrB/RegB family redox-sensitive histidine kinase [Phenylobacterium sp.]|jgi:two-component system sensor histidine kinase RegB|uniref:ActS/PrrB/RegB family redox-sensitive histidine kinase n=1 Tax=Phenylobacterium sp. TaxID=1871053 RepID=UPI002E36FC99|nr:ActS/PrrB/RegB family redox-sensitive histidine kinase [Phenylobacterium sp.]HEX2559356.1 ActS/PrrB/RegB family redox-sensitive histidine kinase [Phenylobacterium sp.]
MATLTNHEAAGGTAVVDRRAPASLQAEPVLGGGGARPGRLKVRTLVNLRWLIIAGEVVILAFVGLIMGFSAPYELCFGLICLSAWLNLLISIASPGQRTAGDWEAAGQLGLDIAQITGLVYLTGGAGNPFMLILIAPVTVAAATLPRRQLLTVGGLAIAASLGLAFFAWPNGASELAPLPYRLGAAAANLAGIVLIAGYVRQAAEESARMALALDVTQAVLAREQRLSALGGLAAAAAHELGTPLATITIVAKELAREAPTPQVKEDAELLMAQTERCREILRRLSETPDTGDEVHERMSMLQLVQEVIEPHADRKEVRVEAIVTGAPGTKPPYVGRMPEITHAMTSFVENAVDFAKSEVLVTARFDAETVSMEVRDDGPGFAPDVLAKLGEPYVTTRPGAEGSRTGHIGMGLGFFIAKTLLERTGAVVTFQNSRPHGAVVSARWRRDRIEVTGH